MSDRYSKEEIREIKKPDAFVAWGRVRMEWLGSHSQIALILVVVALVGSFGWYGYTQYKNHLEEKAWESFYTASQKEDKDHWSSLEQMYPSHSSTRAGFLAAVTLADHYFKQAKDTIEKQMAPQAADTKGAKGVSFSYKLTSVPSEKENAPKAIEWYSKALNFSGLSAEERGLVEVNLGGAFEVAGDLAQAEKRYESAAKNGLSKGLAQLGLGRVSEMQGDREKALKIYTQLEQDFSGKDKNPEYLKMAQAALRRIKGELFAN